MNARPLPARLALLLGCLLLCFLPSILGVLYRPGPWYFEELRKPSWNPPSWVFGPTWTFLYITMGVALWRVCLRVSPKVTPGPFLAFATQLLLNGLWSPLFFGMKRPDWALIDIAFLLVAIIWTVRSFLRVDRTAGLLLLPYLAWVSFATALNFELWRLWRS